MPTFLRAAKQTGRRSGNRGGVTADVSRTRAGTVCAVSRPGCHQSRNRSLFMRQRFAIFGGIAPVQPAQARRGNPVAQLDNVHSVLRLNYESLRGLFSLASPSAAKLTLCETEVRAPQSEPICNAPISPVWVLPSRILRRYYRTSTQLAWQRSYFPRNPKPELADRIEQS